MSIFKTGLASAVAIGCCLSMVACDLDTVPQAIYIIGSVKPDDSCKVKAQGGASAEFLGKGTLDLSVGVRYQAYLMTSNKFPSSESLTGFQPPDARLDSSTVSIQAAEITYRLDAALLAQESVVSTLAELGIPPSTRITMNVPAAATIVANTSLPVVLDLIPNNMGLVFRSIPQIAEGQVIEVVAEVILTGFRSDDKAIKTAPWEFAIYLCNNCMVNHVFSESVAKQPFTWPGLEEPLDPTKDMGAFCVPGQDIPMTNAWCGAQYGPDSGKQDLCRLNRCLGKATDTLECEADPKVLPAPAKPPE